MTLPAVEVGDARGPVAAAMPVIPTSLVSRLGLPTQVSGLVATASTDLTQAQQNTLQARLDDGFGTDEWGTSKVTVTLGGDPVDYGAPDWLTTLLIVGAGALLALAAAWIAAALAATESRPDLATLAAVGATPRTRKRVVAAQAGTVAGIGAMLGVLSGYPLGAAFVLYERYRWATPRLTWALTFPWEMLLTLVVGLPLLAVAAAWLATRSRLVLTRRLET
ncbi:hypothetical protein ET495_17200 [Xylanimonas allomyrinae]|uniref:ABC3 transporter permease C-terminal domain-containing protein n=1 Tax=Xylanimonas allomyrinae TaxID=2509459 RepID=A0A4P6EVV2_9MICO|nr:FtsX-like permease family protein [Xylanimonas allomyrinae]QAY64647.1 hypothetical protein ET495_17200 [Xylanimonas allomyrinae]